MQNNFSFSNLFRTLAVLCNLASGFKTRPIAGPFFSLPRTTESQINTKLHRRENNMQLHNRAHKSSLASSLHNNGNNLKSRVNHKVDQRNLSAVMFNGGEAANTSSRSFADLLASFWGSFGVVYILMKAIVRVVPIALEPFAHGTTIPLTPIQKGAYMATCAFFAYAEGYKGFQLKFAPLVVARSFTLQPGRQWSKLHHTILAPLYSMGLFHATRKRMIVSWSVSIGVAVIVAAVKKLPYPWRNIVDAGVVVGLTWGAASIAFGYMKGILKGGASVVADPCLPIS